MSEVVDTDFLLELARKYLGDLFYIDDTNPFNPSCFSREWVNEFGEIVATGESGPFPYITVIEFAAPWAGDTNELSGPGARSLMSCGTEKWIGTSRPFCGLTVALVGMPASMLAQWSAAFSDEINVQHCYTYQAAVHFVAKHPNVVAVIYVGAHKSDVGINRFLADLTVVAGYDGPVFRAEEGMKSILTQLGDYAQPAAAPL